MPETSGDISYRRAGRVLLVHRGAVLLLRGSDPSRPLDGSWWFTVGGGCEEGESTAQAARREAWEETGLALPADLGPVVLHRTAEFSFEGVPCVQTEDFYFAPVSSDVVVTSGWTDLERRSVSDYRWWSLEELTRTEDVVYPAELASLLAPLIARDGLL